MSSGRAWLESEAGAKDYAAADMIAGLFVPLGVFYATSRAEAFTLSIAG
jgi:hypothetical protein